MLTSNVAEAYGFVRTPVADETGAPDLPDIEIIFAAAPYVGEGLVPLPAEGLTVGAILLQPRSRRTIRLASADPAGAAHRPRVSQRPRGVDAATMLAGLAECERLIATRAPCRDDRRMGAARGRRDDDAAERAEASLRRYSHTLYHPVGTARMGLDAASVVDPELRVRGVAGLRVADASVMPTVIRATPTPRDRHRRARGRPHPRGLSDRAQLLRSGAPALAAEIRARRAPTARIGGLA
jgi:choline dehydrogenase